MTQTSRIVLPVDVVALTTNAIKLEEMRAFYPTLLSRKTDLFEAQDPDPQVVVAGKLAQIMDHDPGSALIVEDTGLAFSAWGQLPGALIKSFVAELGAAGLLDLLPNPEARGAIATSAVGIAFQGRSAVFCGSLPGALVPARGELGGWTPVFQPSGAQVTLAQMSRDRRMACTMRRAPFLAAIDWLAGQVEGIGQAHGPADATQMPKSPASVAL